MRVVLKTVPRTANRLLRCHWGTRARENKRLRNHLVATAGHARFGDTVGKQRVRITVHRRRLQDPDNAVASVKGLVDGLVRLGWLRDDSAEWCELEVKEVKAATKRDERTVIEVLPC